MKVHPEWSDAIGPGWPCPPTRVVDSSRYDIVDGRARPKRLTVSLPSAAEVCDLCFERIRKLPHRCPV